MRARLPALMLSVLVLAGCDRLTGADQQKIFDAEAVGYACRVSLKAPEDCMKENEGHSPTSVLAGWKAANKDIENGIIDPSMGKNPRPAAVAENARATPETAPAEAGKGGAETSPKPEAAKPHAAPAHY